MRTRQLGPDTQVGLFTVGIRFDSFDKMVDVQHPQPTSAMAEPVKRESSEPVGR